jgi:protein gp37
MKNSNIEWTDHTFNPWIGCTKVSPGCFICYAEQLDITRFSKVLGEASKAQPVSHWGPGAPRHRTSEAYWKQPLRWNAEADPDTGDSGLPAALGHRRPRVFCASLADWLDEEIPIRPDPSHAKPRLAVAHEAAGGLEKSHF